VTAGRAGTPERRLEQRYGLLLLVLVASFAIQGIAPGGSGWRAIVTVLLGSASLIAFRAADMPLRRFRVAAALVGAAVAAALVALLAGDSELASGFTGLANALLVGLAPPAIVVGVVRSMRAHGAVTLQVLFGALCLYLLVGMFFAFLYVAIDQIGGSPFFGDGIEATPSRAIYFSLTTLTTVGYGDLTAAGNLGHTLSVTEALVGQIYLVTVVSVVVANLVPRRRLDH
jgi:Ion channel